MAQGAAGVERKVYSVTNMELRWPLLLQGSDAEMRLD
jgi:hypothetical protein